MTHGNRDALRNLGLFICGSCDTFDHLRLPFHSSVDGVQRPTSIISELGTFYHFLRAIFHSNNCFVGITLNTLDEGRDTLGRLSRTFRKKTNFIRDDSEAASVFTRHCRLNSGVEGQEVRLIGNIFNDTHDFTDLIRSLTQAFDLLGGILHVFANEHHAFNGLAHSILTDISVA